MRIVQAVISTFLRIWRRGPISPLELLDSVLRRMRQPAFVILDPCQIARVDKAAANLAAEIMFGLADAPPVGALAGFKLRGTQCEPMFSALPSNSDIARRIGMSQRCHYRK